MIPDIYAEAPINIIIVFTMPYAMREAMKEDIIFTMIGNFPLMGI